MYEVELTRAEQNRSWELVQENHPNFDSNGEIWGTLYRFPVYRHVRGGRTVKDGFSQKHTAPEGDGLYTLYQYVQDGSHMGSKWEKET